MGQLGKFEGYSLREIEHEDGARLDQWIAADPVHAGVLDPEFFADPRVTALVLEDRRGPLMFIRLARSTRVHIQFPPEPREKGIQELIRHRKQLRNALIKGMAFLEVGLGRAGSSEWIFESRSDNLRRLVEKRMGFQPSPNEMVRQIKEG